MPTVTTTMPSPGAVICAELQRDPTPRRSAVEYVGGPRCGEIEVVDHPGVMPPRTLPGPYRRMGRRLCASGAHRYEHRRGDESPRSACSAG
ncbi:hypothetical protein ACL02T_09440 [Pseudonocardia sp. RS010]|uniref:hypothetical protein n=1 Tax=Pseudonocardia sp. RS010 TaxID=3385979 RepID=UPI0039A02371